MKRVDAEFGLKLLAAIIAVFGVWKFFSDRALSVEVTKQERSLVFIEAYASEEMSASRLELFEFWKNNSEFMAHIREQQTTKRAYALFAKVSLSEYPKSAELQHALFQLASFYDQVWYCRSAGLCNRNMLDEYFCPRVQLQSAAYGPFFKRLAQFTGFEGFGGSLKEYEKYCSDTYSS